MGVPEEIRKVKHPPSTTVSDSHTNGIKRYAVRRRKGVVRKEGQKPWPVNGPVIGHIHPAELRFVAKTSSSSLLSSTSPICGNVAFAWSQSQDILTDLRAAMPEQAADCAAVLAMLRVCFPVIAAHRYGWCFDHSCARAFLPGIALNPKTIAAGETIERRPRASVPAGQRKIIP